MFTMTVPGSTRNKTNGPTIAILNQSTVVSDAEVLNAVRAIQIQIDRDFAPIWEMGANLEFIPPEIKQLQADAWIIYVLDTSDQAGALGYHDMTPTGMPIAKIFAKDDQKYNLSWTVTLSHEVLEMIGDPYLGSVVFAQESNTTGILFPFEMCDACEDDLMGYMIEGVHVSDFLYPTWFEGFRLPNSAKFDHMGYLTAPFQIGAAGYSSVFSVDPNTQGWTQMTHASGPGQRLLSKGPESRKARRWKQNP